jgi:hypothetical protein
MSLLDDVDKWSDKEIVAALVKRYRASVIPKCRVCGTELSVQRCGGGQPTIWACSHYEDDPDKPGHCRPKSDRSIADEHFEQSEYTDYRQGGDDVVIEAIRRWRPDLAVEEGIRRA